MPINGTGKGGKSFQDRELAAKVRTLALEQIRDVLLGKQFSYDIEFHKAVLIKLAGTILPRLNEHTGADGGAIEVNDVTKLSDAELEKLATGSESRTSKKGTS